MTRRYRLRLGPLEARVQLGRRHDRTVQRLSDDIEVHGPRPAPTAVRDPQGALDFLRHPALAGDGTAPNPAAQAAIREMLDRQAAATTLEEKVASRPWYHTIELPGGVVTPGNHDHRPIVDHVGLPRDLSGLRALDVATFDGFWAFELERRGARVTAIDVGDVLDLDWPTGVRAIMQAEELGVATGSSFAVAAEALGSDVKPLPVSVYDLTPETVGQFDLVFVGDLLLHLERPLAALRAIRSVCRGTLIVMDRYEPELSGPGAPLVRYVGGWKGLEWWAPSIEALAQWVVDAGFRPPSVHTTFSMRGYHKGLPGWHRAVLHARA